MVNNLILLFFGYFLRDYLTLFSLILIALGVLVSGFKIQFSKTIRNIIAALVFMIFFLTVKKVTDPEGWLNFLTAFLVLKTFEKENIRDTYIQFFGLILILSVGSLFERDILYALFFAVSLGFLLHQFYSFCGHRSDFKKVGGVSLIFLPFIATLFFIIPRSMSPIPLGTSTSREGKVGYTPEVNLSSLDSLSSDQTPVFQAMVSKEQNRSDLYWRGNILSRTDGWNWPIGEKHFSREFKKEAEALPNEVKQRIRLHSYQESFFGLDYPRAVSFNGESIILGPGKSLQQTRNSWRNSYTVVSDQRNLFESRNAQSREYLQTSFSKKEKDLVNQLFPEEKFSETLKSIQNYFLAEKFQYSLSPGKIQSFEEFITVKKIGLCSHYSSAVALILRTKGIPARLVSGFLGGEFNEFGNYYLVTQNDAHVWVEALHEGRWHRIDPTEWIVPERVNLSGNDFISEQIGEGALTQFFTRSSHFRKVEQWFEQWNFAFYQWIDEVDYFSQIAFLERLNLKRNVLFFASAGVLFLFVVVTLMMVGKKKKRNREILPVLWEVFFQKLQDRGLKFSRISVEETRSLINDPILLYLFEDLVDVTFKGKPLEKKLIRKIKSL